MSERRFGQEGENNGARRVVSRREFLVLAMGGLLSFGGLMLHGRSERQKGITGPLREFDQIERSKGDASRYLKPYSLEEIKQINESGIGLTPKQEQLLDDVTNNIGEIDRINKERTIGAVGAIVATVLTAAHFFVRTNQEINR